MVKIKRMMETDENGVKRQFMPVTEVSAVLGLEKVMNGQSEVLSVNGHSGAVVLTKADLGFTSNSVTLSEDEYNILLQIISDYKSGNLGNNKEEAEGNG